MSHELTINEETGFVSHAYVGDVGWHGLGNPLREDAPMEEWYVASGMAHTLKRSPVFYPTDDIYGMGQIEDKHVLYRSDNKMPMGIVSDNYKIVQPREVLDFFKDLVAGNGFKLNTAGTLFGGKRMWALASIGEQACIMGQNDKVGGYLLLSTSCDGTLATEARFTTVRVVCNNTLRMAKSEKDAQIVKISHKTAFNAQAMHDKLGIATDTFAEFINASRKLASVKVDNVKSREFIEKLLFVPELSYENQSTQVKNKADAIQGLFNGAGKGATLDGVRGTAWGLLNAVTEYVDHHTSARSADARLNSALFDKGDELKTEAFEMALALA